MSDIVEEMRQAALKAMPTEHPAKLTMLWVGADEIESLRTQLAEEKSENEISHAALINTNRENSRLTENLVAVTLERDGYREALEHIGSGEPTNPFLYAKGRLKALGGE